MRQHAAERPHRPLFLWLSLNAPHTPMQAPEAAVARFPASYPPETRTYLAMVESMDAAFGVAVEALRDTRMLPRALVLFLADNGGPMIPPACNGGLRGGKGTPFEGGVRAPAFVHWPSCLGRQPRRSSAPAHMVDWLATFVALGGGDATALDPTSDSIDHWEYITGRSRGSPRKTIVFAASANTAAIRSGNYKLMHHMLNTSYFHTWFNGTTDSHPWACNSNEMESYFFDVANDPYEQIDLSLDPGYAEQRGQLNAIWLDAYENEFWVPSWPFETLSPGTPQAEMAEDAIHANGGYVTHWGCQAHLRD